MSMRMKTRSRAQISIVLSAFALFLIFQNCSPTKYSAIETASQPSTNVGGGSNGGFDGKLTYVEAGDCGPSGATTSPSTKARVVMAPQFESITLVRDNCADLPADQQTSHSARSFSFKDENRSALAFQGRLFVLEKSALAPLPLELKWICSSQDGAPNSVRIFEDLKSAKHYNQYAGFDGTDRQVATDLVVASKTETFSSLMFATAPFDSNDPTTSITVHMPSGGAAYASVHLGVSNIVSFPATCFRMGDVPTAAPSATPAPTGTPTPSPSPAPSATPLPSATPSPTPPQMALKWTYIGQISGSKIQQYQIPHCPIESVSPGPCTKLNAKCYVFMGMWFDPLIQQNMYNYFNCQ